MKSIITLINEELATSKLYVAQSKLYKNDVAEFIKFAKTQYHQYAKCILNQPITLSLNNCEWKDVWVGGDFSITDKNTVKAVSIMKDYEQRYAVYKPENFIVFLQNKDKKVVTPNKQFSGCTLLNLLEQIELGNITGDIYQLLQLIKDFEFDRKSNALAKKLFRKIDKERTQAAKQKSEQQKLHDEKAKNSKTKKIKVKDRILYTKQEFIEIVRQFKDNHIELIEDEISYLNRGLGKYKEFIGNMADLIADEYNIDYDKSYLKDETIWDVISNYIYID